jgi:hypothetical protein
MEVYRGFPVKDLQRIFNKIKNKDDWKEPIAVAVPVKEASKYCAAIAFFTATDCEIQRTQLPDYVVLFSIGYRMGPAGDH